ncbi:basic salivary proline-rich protein 1-like [Lontra canadensis]|uniref:basic salivary proline-rich protein 1-like n=1 Tax=Lontra canadensis TaxID=76717 RepID=UPI0013F34D03|nr:basic salivary proline-rich protein 1-like [Lontra canadensis]
MKVNSPVIQPLPIGKEEKLAPLKHAARQGGSREPGPRRLPSQLHNQERDPQLAGAGRESPPWDRASRSCTVAQGDGEKRLLDQTPPRGQASVRRDRAGTASRGSGRHPHSPSPLAGLPADAKFKPRRGSEEAAQGIARGSGRAQQWAARPRPAPRALAPATAAAARRVRGARLGGRDPGAGARGVRGRATTTPPGRGAAPEGPRSLGARPQVIPQAASGIGPGAQGRICMSMAEAVPEVRERTRAVESRAPLAPPWPSRGRGDSSRSPRRRPPRALGAEPCLPPRPFRDGADPRARRRLQKPALASRGPRGPQRLQ